MGYDYDSIRFLIDVAKECETMDDFWEYIGGNGLEQDFLYNIGAMTQEQIDDLSYDMTAKQCTLSDVFFNGIFAVAHKG